jgi:crossover junction endodeoxyribonuclease RusA
MTTTPTNAATVRRIKDKMTDILKQEVEQFIILPYPPSILNPNNKTHWSKKAKAVKRYRAFCGFTAAAAGNKPKCFNMRIEFYPPDRRSRDKDNMIAAFKAGQDGLADAWKVNDSKFNFEYVVMPPVKDGQVRVVYF